LALTSPVNGRNKNSNQAKTAKKPPVGVNHWLPNSRANCLDVHFLIANCLQLKRKSSPHASFFWRTAVLAHGLELFPVSKHAPFRNGLWVFDIEGFPVFDSLCSLRLTPV
jgi:hypothetical protein